MGFFDQPSEEEKKQKTAEALAAMEQKVRDKAARKGFDVTNAVYVLEAFVPKEDETKTISRPFVAIYKDKVVQIRKSIFNSSNEEIPLERISSVEITAGLMPSVNVYTSGNVLTFRTDVLQGPRFVEVLKGLIGNGARTKSGQGSSDVEQLEKLANLFEKGFLTKSEFEKKKKQILGV
jgi:CRISPR/Cas system-associated endonuclease Cas3-HD